MPVSRILLVLLVTICTVYTTAQRAKPRQRTQPVNINLSPGEQAIITLQNAWEQLWTKCEDSHVALLGGDACIDIACTGGRRFTPAFIAQRRNVAVSIMDVSPLTEADQLNGVGWKGNVQITWTAERLFNLRSNRWEDWKPAQGRKRVYLERRNSQWNTEHLWRQLGEMQWAVRKITCADLSNPGGLKKDLNNLSETYGIVNGTIFNKKTKVVFTSAEEFFADSGRKSFDGLTYDRMTSLPPGLRFADGRGLTEADYRRIQGR